jgi:hypothetical protein
MGLPFSMGHTVGVVYLSNPDMGNDRRENTIAKVVRRSIAVRSCCFVFAEYLILCHDTSIELL